MGLGVFGGMGEGRGERGREEGGEREEGSGKKLEEGGRGKRETRECPFLPHVPSTDGSSIFNWMPLWRLTRWMDGPRGGWSGAFAEKGREGKGSGLVGLWEKLLQMP